MINFILLFFGFLPVIILLIFYIKYIHPNQAKLQTNIKKLGLPNKVAVISLFIAIAAFIYSILYSSISTYLSLSALASADSSSIEQKRLFTIQMDLLRKQQATLDTSVKLAQIQVNNFSESTQALKEMVEVTKSQLSILNDQRQEQIDKSKLKSKLKIGFLSNGKELTEDDLQRKTQTIEVDKNGEINLSVFVKNIGNKTAQKVVLIGTIYPVGFAEIFERGTSAGSVRNSITMTEYANHLLNPQLKGKGTSFLYALTARIHRNTKTIRFHFRVECDDIGVSEDFKSEFTIDYSKYNP